MYLVVHRSSGLSRKEFHLTNSECRQDGHGEEDDSDTANPLRHAPPEEDAVRLSVAVINDSGTCGGESRYGFKKCARHVGDRSAEEERQHSDGREEHPNDGDDEITVASAHILA